jgi:outer membrane lipoprotein SlyB
MKRFLTLVSAMLLLGAVAASAADGWRLPRSHRYETYEPATGGYTQVDVDSVPSRIAQGDWIFDRTANVWVHHPSVGNNPQYVAAGVAGDSDALVQDGWRLPRAHRYETYDVNSARYTQVGVSDVPGRLARGEWIFDRTANAWVSHPSVGRNPQYLASGAAPGEPSAASQRLRGTVERIDGSMIRVRTDDGRRMAVDVSQARQNLTDTLRPGERVVFAGVPGDGNRFVARFISDERRGLVDGQSSSQAAPPASGSDQISGRVTSLSGSKLNLTADDGRRLRVDVSQVDKTVLNALNPGDTILLSGQRGGQSSDDFTARYIERGAASASPSLEASPFTRDDCRDGGWRKYTKPTFRNQGDCVSWVNANRR